MATACQREAWGHTANLIFWLSEVWRATGNFKKMPKQLTWQQCNPFAEKERKLMVPISALRDVFLKGQRRKPKK